VIVLLNPVSIGDKLSNMNFYSLFLVYLHIVVYFSRLFLSYSLNKQIINNNKMIIKNSTIPAWTVDNSYLVNRNVYR